MKISERIVDKRSHDMAQRSTNQCGFVADYGTVDALQAVCLLIEKYREKHKQPTSFFALNQNVQ